jgi:anti-sigma B factor antagonist
VPSNVLLNAVSNAVRSRSIAPIGYPPSPYWAGCGLPYIVTRVDSEFPADIIGLQVAEHGPDARVVVVTGEVDTLTAPKLASFLSEQLSVARVVVVDLDGVKFLGSAGLSVLFEANELATRERRVLRLVCHSRIANRALEATELRQHFSFAETVPDALKDSL